VATALCACPDIVPSYFRQCHVSFDPRLSDRWVAAMALLCDTWAGPLPPSNAAGITATLEHRQHMIVPPVVARSVLSPGLQSPEPIVVTKILQFLLLIFRRFAAAGRPKVASLSFFFSLYLSFFLSLSLSLSLSLFLVLTHTQTLFLLLVGKSLCALVFRILPAMWSKVFQIFKPSLHFVNGSLRFQW
jgi:hypothetical protein